MKLSQAFGFSAVGLAVQNDPGRRMFRWSDLDRRIEADTATMNSSPHFYTLSSYI